MTDELASYMGGNLPVTPRKHSAFLLAFFANGLWGLCRRGKHSLECRFATLIVSRSL
jgi:hypothetical protein